MKRKFKFVGNAESKITIEVTIDTKFNPIVRRGEVADYTDRMKNKVHAMLRDSGYDVSQIKEVK